MAHNQMTVFILENLLLFISHLLQRHTDRRRWLSPLSFSVSRTLSLSLSVCGIIAVRMFFQQSSNFQAISIKVLSLSWFV